MLTIHLKPSFKKKGSVTTKTCNITNTNGWSSQSLGRSCLVRRYRDWLRSATKASDWLLIF